jgi:D-alanyl-D-alanine carboxypeptidase
VTKTFTAAPVLRLIEENALQLTDTIDSLISDEFKALLESDSYPIDTITVKHLLSHTAGLFDHAQSQAFLDALLASPTQNKDMAFHINGLINWGEPIAKPDERFFYSDTGYILLGHIIERITQKPLPQAVREYLNFHQNKIYQVVWERDDSVTPPEGLRVHQSFHNIDTYSWDPSMDLYGGGGLLASPRGMAKFFQRLFAGNVFSKPATLEQMLSPLGLPADSPYRLGVFERDYDGLTVYEHSGFWGNQVMVAPKYNVVIAGAVTKQEDYKALVNVMRQYLNAVSQ